MDQSLFPEAGSPDGLAARRWRIQIADVRTVLDAECVLDYAAIPVDRDPPILMRDDAQQVVTERETVDPTV